MKPTLCLLAILLCSYYTFAQTKELKQRIAISETLRRLEYEKKYDSIILVAKMLPPVNGPEFYTMNTTIATAYLEKGKEDVAMKYLETAVKLQELNGPENIAYLFGKYKLDNNTKYKFIVSHFDSLHSYYDKNLNLPVLNACMEIFYTNVQMRYVYNQITDTTERKYATHIMWLSDSMNIEQMKLLLRKEGRYPGKSDIGLSFTLSFNYIVTHFASLLDRDTLYNYLHTATLRGELPNWYGPRMLDKLEFDQGKPNIYGEFGWSDDIREDGTNVLKPIADIEYVDKRRAEFLLPPLYTEKFVSKCILPEGYDPKTQKK